MMIMRNQEILVQANYIKPALIDIPRLLKRATEHVDCRLPRYKPDTKRLSCK